MAIEQRLQELVNPDGSNRAGPEWFRPISLKTLIEQDRVRVAGYDNLLLLGITLDSGSEEVWAPVDAARLDAFFRAAPA